MMTCADETNEGDIHTARADHPPKVQSHSPVQHLAVFAFWRKEPSTRSARVANADVLGGLRGGRINFSATAGSARTRVRNFQTNDLA